MTVSAASLFATLPDAGATAFAPDASAAGSDPAFDALVSAFLEAADPAAATTASPQSQAVSSQATIPAEQEPAATDAQTTEAPVEPSGNQGRTESSRLLSSFFSVPQAPFANGGQAAPAAAALPLMTGTQGDGLSGNEQQPISTAPAAPAQPVPAPRAPEPAQTPQIPNSKPQQADTVSTEATAAADTHDEAAVATSSNANNPLADDVAALVTTGFAPLTETASRLPAPQPIANAKESATPAKADDADAAPEESLLLPAVHGSRVASSQDKTEVTDDQPHSGIDLVSLSDMASRVIAQFLAAQPMPQQQTRPTDGISQTPPMDTPSEASPSIPANAPAAAPQTNLQSAAEESSAPAAAKPDVTTPMPTGIAPSFGDVPADVASAASPNTSPVTAGANPAPAANNVPATRSLPSQIELSAQRAAPGEPQRPASPQISSGSTERPVTIVSPDPTTAAQGTAQSAEDRTQTQPVPAGATASQNPAAQIDADGSAFVAQRDVPLPDRAASQPQRVTTSSDDAGNVIVPALRNANLIQPDVAAPKPQTAAAPAFSGNTVSQTQQNTPAPANGPAVNNVAANAEPETTEATPPASPNPAPASSTRVAEDKNSSDAQTDGRALNVSAEPKDSGADPDAGASHAAEAAPPPAPRATANATPAPATAQSTSTSETDQPAPAVAISVPNQQTDAVQSSSTDARSRPAAVAAPETADRSEPVLRETSAKPAPAPRPVRAPLRASSNNGADDADASSQTVGADRQDANAGGIAPVPATEHAHDQTKPAAKPAMHIADAAPVADAPKAHDAADTNGTADLAVPQTVRNEPATSAPPIHTGSSEPMLPSPATMPQGMEMAAPAGATRGPEQDVPVKLAFTAPNVPDHAAFDEMALKIAAHSSNGENNFSIRLDPVELGKIEINLSVDAHGHAQAELTADKPQTLELFQKDASALERALKDAGLNMSGGLSFSLKGDGRSQTWRDPQGGRSRSLQIGAADAASANASITARAALAAQAYGLPITQLDIRV